MAHLETTMIAHLESTMDKVKMTGLPLDVCNLIADFMEFNVRDTFKLQVVPELTSKYIVRFGEELLHECETLEEAELAFVAEVLAGDSNEQVEVHSSIVKSILGLLITSGRIIPAHVFFEQIGGECFTIGRTSFWGEEIMLACI
jgi:hypothetical protein